MESFDRLSEIPPAHSLEVKIPLSEELALARYRQDSAAYERWRRDTQYTNSTEAPATPEEEAVWSLEYTLSHAESNLDIKQITADQFPAIPPDEFIMHLTEELAGRVNGQTVEEIKTVCAELGFTVEQTFMVLALGCAGICRDGMFETARSIGDQESWPLSVQQRIAVEQSIDRPTNPAPLAQDRLHKLQEVFKIDNVTLNNMYYERCVDLLAVGTIYGIETMPINYDSESFTDSKIGDEIHKQVDSVLVEVLKTYAVEEVTPLTGGSNEVNLAKLKNDGSGVFKSRSGEEDMLRVEIPNGTQYLREYAASRVDRALGFNLVPPTILRELPEYGIGSFQKFIPDVKPAHFFLQAEMDQHPKINDLTLFDIIIWNTDRHRGNFLMSPDQLYAIDNSLSFAYGFLNTRSVMYGAQLIHGEITISPRLADKIASFTSDNKNIETLETELSDVLLAPEITALRNRIVSIAAMIRTGNRNLNFFETEFGYNGIKQ